MNFLAGAVETDGDVVRARAPGMTVALPAAVGGRLRESAGRNATLGSGPSISRSSPTATAAPGAGSPTGVPTGVIDGRVDVREPMGSEVYLYVDTEAGPGRGARAGARRGPRGGDPHAPRGPRERAPLRRADRGEPAAMRRAPCLGSGRDGRGRARRPPRPRRGVCDGRARGRVRLRPGPGARPVALLPRAGARHPRGARRRVDPLTSRRVPPAPRGAERDLRRQDHGGGPPRPRPRPHDLRPRSAGGLGGGQDRRADRVLRRREAPRPLHPAGARRPRLPRLAVRAPAELQVHGALLQPQARPQAPGDHRRAAHPRAQPHEPQGGALRSRLRGQPAPTSTPPGCTASAAGSSVPTASSTSATTARSRRSPSHAPSPGRTASSRPRSRGTWSPRSSTTGRAAMAITGQWFLGEVKRGVDFGVALLADGHGGRRALRPSLSAWKGS
ncbi:MAG: hypothetical protein MZV63_09785 [Marinilabiliales bacterium]|nr:hypothetical protein [Marinilabiliales bacterium]